MNIIIAIISTFILIPLGLFFLALFGWAICKSIDSEMTPEVHLQNVCILAAACVMSWLFNSGWPFLLLLLWCSPKDGDGDE